MAKSKKSDDQKPEKAAPKATKAKAAPAASTAKKAPLKRSSPLAQAKSILNEHLKTQDWHTNLDPKRAREAHPHLPTGSIILNHLIGGKMNAHGVSPCPGIPKGRIFNLYGHESSGKSTIALTASATTIKAGGTVCYIDWEHEIVPSYAQALGVPIGDDERFMLCQPDTLDDGFKILWVMASAGIDLIVLDSVGAGVPKAYFDKKISETAEQGRVGANAAMWSQFLPKLKTRIGKTGTAIIGISQIRDAINTMGYGDKITVQGGKAWKFYSAIRMKLQKVQSEKGSGYSSLTNKAEDRVTGAKIRAKLDKCKISSQQGNEEDFYIRWGEGIDDIRSLLEIAISHRLASKNGSTFSWTDPEGNQHKRAGMEKFRQVFADNPKLMSALEKQVKPYLALNGVSAGASAEDDDDDGGDLGDLFDEEFNVETEIEDILSDIGSDSKTAAAD